MKRFFLLLLILWLAVPGNPASAQGFARQYPDGGGFSPWCQLQELPDGFSLHVNNYAFGGSRFRLLTTDKRGVLTGDTLVDFQDTTYLTRHVCLESGRFMEVKNTIHKDSLYVRLLTPNGGTQWALTIDVPDFKNALYSVVAESAAGNIYIAGTLYQTPSPANPEQVYVLKINPLGELLWIQTWGSPTGQTYFDEDVWYATPDDGIALIVNRATSDWAVKTLRFGPDGTLLWETRVGQHTAINVADLAVNAAGETGLVKHDGSSNFLGHFILLDSNGDTLVHQLLNNLFGQPTQDVNPRNVFAYPDNAGWLVTGLVQFSGGGYNHFFLMRLDNTGAPVWVRTPNPFGQDVPYIGDAVMLEHESCVLSGTVSRSVPNILDNYLPCLLKIDSMGLIYAHGVAGWVRLDQDLDCFAAPTELPFPWAVVQLAPATGEPPVLLTTDTSGYYYFTDVDTGQYALRAFPPNGYWEFCDSLLNLSVTDSSASVIGQNLSMQALTACPLMTVGLSTLFLRPCQSSQYVVQYCNYGSATADSAYVRLVLDPVLTFESASIPYSQTGDTLHFNLGTVAPFDCGSFSLNVQVDCDSIFLGQTACVEAAIFPDSLCDWSGATLVASGHCDGDSVRFHIRNIGLAPTSNGLNFIIADDHVIMLQQPLPPLPAGGTYPISVPADGSSWRLLVEQEPNNPGGEGLSVAVEHCGPDVPGGASSGFVLQLPNTDGNPFTTENCQEIRFAWDPNDKSATPQGVGAEHFIEQNTPIDYRIRFQNTGTDTAFTVVLKDTLSPWLDPASVRPGPASHPYTWHLSGAGVITFTFENILLPDSNVNEAASHGFVQFGIRQRPDNPPGALVENRAGIYFDFNDPVMTNTVWHTVGHHFLTSAVREPGKNLPALDIWPNPAHEAATVRMDQPLRAGQQLVMRDVWGRVVREIPVRDTSVEISRSALPAGMYFLELGQEKGPVAVGKIIWN